MPIATGGCAPDFSLPYRDGGTFRLAEIGTPLLLAFYKTTCPTSRLVLPFLERLHQAYPRLTALGVSQDPAAETDAFVGELGVTFPMLLESRPWEVSARFGLVGVPTVFLIGPIGGVEDAMEGWQRSAINRLAASAARLVGAAPVTLSTPDDGAPELKPG